MSELALTQQLDSQIPVDPSVTEVDVWVERARAGDLEAFELIMMRFEARILRFLTGLVGDPEVARELCQDTFLSAYQALPRVHGELRLSAWLHTIALNRARSHHRRRKHKILVPIEDHDVPAPNADLQDSVVTVDIVRRTLARMPKQYAEVLLLQIASGLSCREIAETLHCSEAAVKVRLMRARESFRRQYGEEGGEPCAI